MPVEATVHGIWQNHSMHGPDPSPAASRLPPRPRLTLRVGFAGSQRLLSPEQFSQLPEPRDESERAEHLARGSRMAAERQRLKQATAEVLKCLEQSLASIRDRGAAQPSGVSGYFKSDRPLMRWVTGLCEGADDVVAEVIEDRRRGADSGRGMVELELAAVLPFPLDGYRESRPGFFRETFDQHVHECAWVMCLDGIYDKPGKAELEPLPREAQDARKSLANLRRARGYRAQSTFLIRQSDLIVAAANPQEAGSAGGTLETVREALAFGLPVVFIDTSRAEDQVRWIRPDEDHYSVIAGPLALQPWEEALHQGIHRLLAAPDPWAMVEDPLAAKARDAGDGFLREFFDVPTCPPGKADGSRRAGLRERLWEGLRKRLEGDAPPHPTSRTSTRHPIVETYRARARGLNHHYSGQYRGALVLNYVLSLVTVFLATVSLALLDASNHIPAVQEWQDLLKVSAGPKAGIAPAESMGTAPSGSGNPAGDPVIGGQLPNQDTAGDRQQWLPPMLLSLAGFKLFLVIFIKVNTVRANRGQWNERAIDTRYLTERLRSLEFLPRLGCQRAPNPGQSQLASRFARQSAVDWLFEAIARTLKPGDAVSAMRCSVPTEGSAMAIAAAKKPEIISPDPIETLSVIRDDWIGQQAAYHQRNAVAMGALDRLTERWNSILGWWVIGVVLLDIGLATAEMTDGFPPRLRTAADRLAPWLIFASAVLPAMVTALGGLRFQSECRRLAERSALMHHLLRGRHGTGESRWEQAESLVHRMKEAKSNPATDVGGWTHEVLRFSEHLAADLAGETAEWSVIYSKELRDQN